MVKGGYQIINLDGVVHNDGSGVTHEGIYERINATQKPIMFSGININGVDYHDCYVEPKVKGSNYEFKIYGYKVTVTNSDVVTFKVSDDGGYSIKTIAIDNDFDTNPTYTPSEEVYRRLLDGLQNIPFKIIYNYTGRQKESLIISADVADNTCYGLRENSNFSLRISDSTVTYTAQN